MSTGSVSGDGPIRNVVAPEAVEQNLDWSEPVRFKFVKREDGRVEMWLQAVERN